MRPSGENCEVNKPDDEMRFAEFIMCMQSVLAFICCILVGGDFGRSSMTQHAHCGREKEMQETLVKHQRLVSHKLCSPQMTCGDGFTAQQ